LNKRQLTIRYVIFYILFLPDSWQILTGVVAAYFLSPFVGLTDTGNNAKILVFIMIATIGYAASRLPARWLTRILIKWTLGEKRP